MKEERSAVDQALALLRNGDLDGAERVLGAIEPTDPSFARARLQLGNIRLGRRQVDAARRAYEEAIAADGANPAAWNNLGNALVFSGDLERAREAFARAHEFDGGYIDPLVNLGALAASQRQFDAALTWSDRALAIDPRSPVARRGRVTILEGLRRIDEAAGLLEELSNESPQELELLLGRASLLARYSRVADAITVLRGALKDAPQSVAVHTALADCLLRSQDVGGAEAHLEAALAAEPDNVALLTNLGVVRVQTGRQDSARELLERALSLSPGYFAAAVNLVHMATLAGDGERATAVAQKAAEASPADPQTQVLLVQQLLRARRAKDAIAAADRARQRIPYDVELLHLRGLALRADGRTDEARVALEECLLADPFPSAAAFHLAQLHLEQGHHDRALSVLQDAVARVPDAAPLHAALGDVARAGRDNHAARAAYERAVELEPRNPAVWDALVGVLIESGDTRAVIDAYRRTLRANPGLDVRRYSWLGSVDLDR